MKTSGRWLRQFAGDRQQDVRVDGDAAGVDDLELHRREPFPQHYVKVTAERVRRIGIAHGRRFSEHENPEGPLRLLRGNGVRLRRLDHARRKKWGREEEVVASGWLSLERAGDQQFGGESDSRKPQTHFYDSEKQDRNQDGTRDTRYPIPPSRNHWFRF